MRMNKLLICMFVMIIASVFNKDLFAEFTPTHPIPIIEYQYSYDNVGNITGIQDQVNSINQVFTYDEVNRLTSASGGPYGNQTYQYKSTGEILGGVDPGTDANGNATSYNTKTITYDYENRPISITESGITTTFAYDYAGQRVKKTANGVTTLYIGNIYEVTGDTETVYIYAGSMRVASAVTNGTDTSVYYYHNDHLNSSNILTDDTGVQMQYLSYEPWGSVVQNSSSTYNAYYKFTGQPLDDSTGLYYYGARYYDPVLRRFVTPDPLVQNQYDPQSLNRFAYCRNNPLIYKDPSGHFFWFAVGSMAMFNTFENSERIHNFGDFAKYATIGAAEGALIYLTGGAGAAGTGRVFSQIASVMIMQGANSMMGNPMRGMNRSWQIATYIVASAMIQGGMQHKNYSKYTSAELKGLTKEELVEAGEDNARRADFINKLGLKENPQTQGGTMLSGIPAENWKKVYSDGEFYGVVGTSRAFGGSPLTHTASATVNKVDRVVGWEYFWSKGVCHQDVTYQFWQNGLQVAPSQLFHTFDAYLASGVYGPIGGSGAFQTFMGVNYYNYRNMK